MATATCTFPRPAHDAAPRSSRPSKAADATDTLLVQQAVAGDPGAFSELVRRHQDRIYAVVQAHCRSAADAVDLTQEIFVKAYRRLPTFREGSAFYTWLYRIAINTCIDEARRRERRVTALSLEEEVFTENGFEPEDARVSSHPERSLLNQEMGTMLRAWIQGLPEAMRLAVLLHDVAGLSQEQAAQVLGCPIGTVKSRLQRGRWTLRERAREYFTG